MKNETQTLSLFLYSWSGPGLPNARPNRNGRRALTFTYPKLRKKQQVSKQTMPMDWNAEQVSLTTEELAGMTNKVFTIAREVQPRTIESDDGRKFKLFDITVENSEGKLRNFSVFSGDIEPVTKLIQAHNLKGQAGIKEIGIRLTLDVVKYKKKDKSDASKISIVKVEGPAQVTL